MVSFRSALLLLLPLAVALTGCDGGGTLCGRVRCESGRVCNPVNGACIVDPNKGDGGTVDAGAVDAGDVDAGADAGTTCVPACSVGVCDPATLSCVVCLTDAQCTCPRPVCDLASHSCVAAPDAGYPVPQVGESCADAVALPFPACSKTTQFRVDLGARKDDDEGTCSLPASLGHDAVFLVELDATYDLKVTATAAPGSAASPVSYLRLSPCELRDELVCVDGLGGPSSFRATSLPAGEYALVIDSFDVGSSGPVDVKVELLPPTAPSNDTCSTPVDAPTDGGTFTVDLSGYGDELVGTCNTFATDSREAVWRVVLDTPSDFHAVASAVDPDGGADPVLYLRSSPCETGKELACVDKSIEGGTETMRVKNLAAGTYYLVVEGYGASGSGPMNVTTWASEPVPPPKNDTCAAPRPITFPSGKNTVSFPVDTSTAEDDEQGSCSVASGAGRDLVFQLSLPVDRTVTISAVRAAGTSTDPVIYLRSGACDVGGGVELACSDAPSASATETISQYLFAGEYYLIVDSYDDASAGPTIVTVTLAP